MAERNGVIVKDEESDPMKDEESDPMKVVYVSSLSRLRQAFDAIESTRAWPQLYGTLRINSQKQEQELKLSTKHARIHLKRNRYRDVLPYDQSRITLMDASPSEDYINASLVTVEEARRKYILTQGPLLHTSGHFWQLVWEQGSMAIIMLNRIVEKEAVKCHQYFPDKEGDQLVFDKFQISFVSCEKRPNYCVRKLLLHRQGSSDASGTIVEQPTRTVTHLQFTTWPDFGVPSNAQDFLEFLYEVRKSDFLNANKYGPPVIHCSAGIGRSGTFVIVDSILVMSQDSECSADVVDLVLRLRKYRMGLIQTHDQLRFSWLAALTALENDKWRDLVNLTCSHLSCTPATERKASFVKRVNANTRIDNTRGLSLDNSDLDHPGSAPKKPRVSGLDASRTSAHKSVSAQIITESPMEPNKNGDLSAAARAAQIRQRKREAKTEELRARVSNARIQMRASESLYYRVLAGVNNHAYLIAATSIALLAAGSYYCVYGR